ncbi:MAG: nucleotidyltransferase domain-containing protein [Nitrospirae bacterium]|nr:nucleotidyltransferase domain-containing protein [Nitrospirota bacterium]
MDEHQVTELRAIFKNYPEVKLVYVFGSRAAGKEGPLSDYDFAVYIADDNRIRNFNIKFSLMDKISRLLRNDNVDVVILNFTESPELKYNIIAQGKLIYEEEPFRVIVEPRILNEYFDFHSLLLKYNLTKA